MTTLSKRRLDAIREALKARLAGEIEDTDLDVRDYEAALRWADGEYHRRYGKGD